MLESCSRVQKSEKSQFSPDALTVTSDAEKNEGEGAQRESTWSKVQRNKAFFSSGTSLKLLEDQKTDSTAVKRGDKKAPLALAMTVKERAGKKESAPRKRAEGRPLRVPARYVI